MVRACIEAGDSPTLIHTGQHYDEKMSSIFFDQLGLPEPDLNLGVGSGSHATQTAALMVALEHTFEEVQPDRVVIYGDVNSTLAAAIVASKLEIDVAHVEAGLRSFDRGMPEEINRVVSDALSSLHFVTSEDAVGHLLREGIDPGGIHFVGNPMIDTLLQFRSQLDRSPSEAFGLSEPYGLVTLHRPSNVDSRDVAAEIVSGLVRVSEFLPLVVPLHPRGKETLSALGLKSTERLVITEPLGYLEFMSLMARAAIVLTDSGGVQEETTVLGVPCLTLRENTERPITIEMGTNRLVPRKEHAIVEATLAAMETTPKSSIPPLWDGDAGGRIARILMSTPVG